jgi:hypothetical protein
MEEAQKRISELEALIEKERAKNERKFTLKVTEKGAVGIYGLRRFPITLYKSEMNKILDNTGAIMEFMRENDEKLR